MTRQETELMLRHLQLAIAKARSNALELMDEDIVYLISPGLDPDSLLNGGLERLLDGRADIDWMGVRNILTLAWRDGVIPLSYGIMWGADLPEPEDILPDYIEETV